MSYNLDKAYNAFVANKNHENAAKLLIAFAYTYCDSFINIGQPCYPGNELYSEAIKLVVEYNYDYLIKEKQMLKMLILEDDDFRINHFKKILSDFECIYCKDYKSAINEFKDGLDLLLLNHDLSEEDNNYSIKTKNKNGSDFCTFLSSYYENTDITCRPFIVIHSMNPYGAKNMENILNSCDPSIASYRIPFFQITKETIINLTDQIKRYKNIK